MERVAAIALSQQEGDSDHFIPPLIEFIPPETVFSRLLLVDHPIIIQFDTGDRLEVLFAHGGEVRVSINALPLSLEAANGARNVNLDLMFSEVIGQRISGIQVGRRKELPEDWEPPHGEDWKEQDALIAYILFETTGEAGLAFEPYKETGRVSALLFQYSTFHRKRPCGGAVNPASARIPLSNASIRSSLVFSPSPTSMRDPVRILTIL